MPGSSARCVEFLVSLFYSILQLILFLGVLWLYSGPLTFVLGYTTVVVPGHMVWVALLYAGLGAVITLWVGYPLVRATDRRQAAEANYRARLVNALAHSPAIALSSSEPGERRRLGIDFERIRLAWAAQKTSFRNLVFLSFGYGQLTAVLPMLILAPRYFSGEMSLGTLMQVTIAFGQVAAALSWLSSNYARIAQWEASAERVLALSDAVADVSHGICDDAGGRLVRVTENGPNFTFDRVSLVNADGQVLVEQFSAEIMPGERVLVEATPQAADGLFRAVGDLSHWGAGRIELPENASLHFLGHRPYLPDTSLLIITC
jgi:vitamin B12/bleomycin/antimicrobial peptide transport system ATP-binding/permease protein